MTPVHAAEAAPWHPERFAVFRNWDERGPASLEAAATEVDVLVPEWYALGSVPGTIIDNQPSVTKSVLADIAARHPKMAIAPIVDNIAPKGVRAGATRKLLADPATRMRLVDALLAKVEANGFAGITVDFQQLRPEDQANYVAFAGELYRAFHAKGLKVFHIDDFGEPTVAPARLTPFADALIALGDSYSAQDGPPGPVAPQDWFEARAKWWSANVPRAKLVVGISNQALDWAQGRSAEDISILEAFRRAGAHGAVPTLNGQTLNTTFGYKDAAGVTHRVWMTDAVSAYNDLRVLARYAPRGIILRRLGTEDPSVLGLLKAPAAPDPKALRVIDAGYQLQDVGTGEVVSVASGPRTGRRAVTLSADGSRVVGARVTVPPHGYEIVHRKAVAKNMIALTFDDGPDAQYTPRILDVLRDMKAPGTFFFVGTNMVSNPGIVSRVLAEGSEVGSHTFTHPNVSRISGGMLRLELDATQSVFESITGRYLTLFRAPYADDINPTTLKELVPLKTVSDLGYLTVNMNIDPDDWMKPPVDQIVARVMAGAKAGNHVVLLHDGGGDRSRTVEALPRIITGLRAKGFQLVSVSTLLGYSPNQVMPVSHADRGLLRPFMAAGYYVIRQTQAALGWLFLAAIALGVARAVLLIVLSTIRGNRTVDARTDGRTVGVVVPAHNEEDVIVRTVRSLLDSDYTNFAVMVVDDGSTDGTLELCRTTFAGEPRVSVITQPNAGKAAALNLGFALLDADIIVAVDADTLLLPDAIGRMVAHFDDPRVAAVSGNAKVGNRKTLLAKWQALEYVTAQNLDRKAFELVNAISVVPGAIGAWKRRAVLEAGGYSSRTLAEDADLTIRLLRAGYRVTYEEDAIAYTEAPLTAGPFMKQRFRWMFGMMQTAVRHLGAFGLRDSKPVAFFLLPNIMIFQVIFPLIAPVADLVALGILGNIAFRLFTDSALLNFNDTLHFLALFGLFLLLDWLTAAVAFMQEGREDKRLLLWLLPQRFFYRQLIYLVAIRATLNALKGGPVGWGKLARSASVVLPRAGR